MPQHTPIQVKGGYAVYSFTSGVVYPDQRAEKRKYETAHRNPEQAFDDACDRGDYAFAHWIIEHLLN